MLTSKSIYLTSISFWGSHLTGHGGSDGLHAYVPSLDYAVEDLVSLSFPPSL